MGWMTNSGDLSARQKFLLLFLKIDVPKVKTIALISASQFQVNISRLLINNISYKSTI